MAAGSCILKERRKCGLQISDTAESSYRIVALRLGHEDARMERAPWADYDPNLYPEKANATSTMQQGGQ